MAPMWMYLSGMIDFSSSPGNKADMGLSVQSAVAIWDTILRRQAVFVLTSAKPVYLCFGENIIHW